MADAPQPSGIGEFFNLLQVVNPLAGIQRSISQFQQGVDGFLRTVENLNDTLEQLNRTAQRINGLLDTVEGPIKAFVPQIQRTIEAADSMVESMSGSVGRVAPGLSSLAETLASAPVMNFSQDIAAFLHTLGDLTRRMQPLSQLAESAGNMFGLRGFGGLLPSASRTAGPAPARPEESPATPRTAKKAAPVKATAKKKGAARKR